MDFRNSPLLIKHGLILDGSGDEPYRGSILIDQGRICSIFRDGESLPGIPNVIDAEYKAVSPGFIDLHTHSDLFHLQSDPGPEKLDQGITTEIFGNCGFSPSPVLEATKSLLQDYSRPIMGDYGITWSWNSFQDYLEMLGDRNHVTNIGSFVGSGALRIAVKGFDGTCTSSVEMDRITGLLRDSLRSGAFGLSMGLMYVPENYYRETELLKLCQVLSREGGILATHIRGEGTSLLSSITEVIDLAKKTGVPLHISHLKSAGRDNWGHNASKAVELLTSARREGLDVTCDVYPYTASSTVLSSLFPPWLMEGGNSEAVRRLARPMIRDRVRTEMMRAGDGWDNLVLSSGWDRVVITCADFEQIIGKSIHQISVERGEDPLDCALNLFIEAQGTIGIVFFSMSEEDLISFMKLDFCSIISDSLYSQEGISHPRRYGSFQRFLNRYVREKGVLPLSEGIRKCTSLPAKRLGLSDRGVLKTGSHADLTIFDPSGIRDQATYSEPDLTGEGIDQVIVNGRPVMKNGHLIDSRAGILLKPQQ